MTAQVLNKASGRQYLMRPNSSAMIAAAGEVICNADGSNSLASYLAKIIESYST